MSFASVRAAIEARQRRELDEFATQSDGSSDSSASTGEYPPELAALIGGGNGLGNEARGVVREELSSGPAPTPPPPPPPSAISHQAQQTPPIPTDELRARLAQYEQQLRQPQLPAQMREMLTARAADLRARLGGGAAALPAAVAAVPVVPLPVVPVPHQMRECVICSESYRLEFARRAAAASQASGGAGGGEGEGGEEGEGGAAPPRKKSKKTMQATSAAVSVVVDRYRYIFQFEEQARGVMNDDFIFPEMVWMHRDFIEAPLERLGFPFLRWTEAALREHYDPINGHVFDKVREVRNDLTQLRALQNLLYNNCTKPDPGNAALRTIDHKAVESYEKIRKSKQQCIDALDHYQSERACVVKTQTRELAIVLGRNRLQESVSINPQVAAGTMRSGGDTLRTAGSSGDGTGQQTLLTFGGF